MKIQFKRIIKSSDFDPVSELYIASFPPEERRELSEIYQLISKGEIFIYQMIIAKNKIAGLCIFWTFDEFTYLEHLAVNPELRGVGIGEETISLLHKKSQVLLLETELPVDDISKRRIKFYERNGFKLMQRQYFQPSYGKGKPEVELKLMSSIQNLYDEKLSEYILQIRNKVYRQVL